MAPLFQPPFSLFWREKSRSRCLQVSSLLRALSFSPAFDVFLRGFPLCVSLVNLCMSLTEWSSWVILRVDKTVSALLMLVCSSFSPHSLRYQNVIKIYMKPPSLGAHLFLLFIPPGESRICHLRFYSSPYPRCQCRISSVRPRCTALLREGLWGYRAKNDTPFFRK